MLGFTDRVVIRDVLQDCSAHRPIGMHLAARQQPAALPGVRERWKFIAPTLQKAPFIKIVPMLDSLGCPYTCSFCIDKALGSLWEWLPEGAMYHDPNAYLKSEMVMPDRILMRETSELRH